MYIHGKFINRQGDTVTVSIVTGGDKTETLEIGAEGSGLYFTDDPVEISSEVNDTFDVLLRHSASIRLLARNFMPCFFSSSCRNAVVNIHVGKTCVFAGFIEPQSYSQPYNELYDELELNCIDALSALQYSKYKDVGALGVSYEDVKRGADQRPFLHIMQEVLRSVTDGLDLSGGAGARILFDGSKAVNGNHINRYNVFSMLKISELLFLGAEEDDVWEQDKVLEEMLRFLNLHVAQEGLTFYIFSWETVKTAAPIKWSDIMTGETVTTQRRTEDITIDNVADCDTNISIGEVYNRLILTCRIEGMDKVVESPLDEESLSSPYSGKQKYMTEYSSDGEGNTAYRAFYNMIKGEVTTYGEADVTDWYIQVMRNPKWKFPTPQVPDLVEWLCKDGKNQQDLPNHLGLSSGAAIFSIGSFKKNMAGKDNAPSGTIKMENNFVLSVQGSEDDTKEGAVHLSSLIKQHIPYAVYDGGTADAVLSPADDNITNYIVFTGQMVLNPIMHMTDFYKVLYEAPKDEWFKPLDFKWWHKTVPSRNNGDGRYYTRKYWRAEQPKKDSDDVVWDDRTDNGFLPFTGAGPEQYEYKGSAFGDGTDKISKVAVLACMLVVGDKCVVEKTPNNDLGTGVAYTGHGAPQDFVWMDYRTREECANDDEYYAQSFTLGFDPKIGDKLIGTEFNMQVNHGDITGIDADGIAIPIRRADKVSGRVEFKILGPVNAMWADFTRLPKIFYKFPQWRDGECVPLLNHVSSIIVKSFEVKLSSDNGGFDNGDTDNDVIYMSDTKEAFVNVKDDLEFNISSDLTLDERKRLGVSVGPKMSTPFNVLTGSGVTTIYDHSQGIEAKPEQLYVDSYYKEYHSPLVVMEQNIIDEGATTFLFNHYRHKAMGKNFFIQGIGRNLIDGTAALTLKEIKL